MPYGSLKHPVPCEPCTVGLFQNRELALIAGFVAIYVTLGYLLSIFRQLTRSTDLFFLIAAFFAILTILIEKLGAASLLGTVAGIIFLAVPSPFPPHIGLSLIANGIVFDLYLRETGGVKPISQRRMVTAGAFGNLAMAVVGLATIQTVIEELPPVVWVLALVVDTVVGAAGALFGLKVARRIQTPAVLTRQP